MGWVFLGIIQIAQHFFRGVVGQIARVHDRDFLDGLVSKVYEFGHGRVREHLCGIYEFLESKKMENLQELEKKQ